MRDWFEKIYWDFKYALDQPRPGTLFDFLSIFGMWWGNRPRLMRCAFCNIRMWSLGKPSDGPNYCSQECAQMDYKPEELPF